MRAAPKSDMTALQTLAPNLWITIRFVIFGAGGFLALWIGTISLIEFFDSGSPAMVRLVAALPLTFAGALMMMCAGGVWCRWAYLWVFLSPPILVAILTVVDRFLPNWERYVPFDPKSTGILFFVVPMLVSYLAAKRYYKRREAAQTPSAPNLEMTDSQGG